MVKQAWRQLLMKVKFFSPYEYKCHIYSNGLTNLRLGASWQPAWQDMSMMHVSIDVAWVGLRLWQKDGSVPISRFLSFTPWTKWSFILTPKFSRAARSNLVANSHQVMTMAGTTCTECLELWGALAPIACRCVHFPLPLTPTHVMALCFLRFPCFPQWR